MSDSTTIRRPQNVIVLCPDELRGDCLGIAGNPDIKTPQMDALMESGVRFSSHFTPFPKCVPARVAMMTGRYCHTDGYRTITQHMPPGQPDVVKTLKANGYEVAVFGKNHCWELDDWGTLLDYWSWKPGPYREIHQKWKAGREAYPDSERAKAPIMEDGYDYVGCYPAHLDDAYVEQAIRFLSEDRDRSRPFFLQVNIEAPHPKYGVVEPYFSRYDRNQIAAFPHQLPDGATLPFTAQREVRTGKDFRPDWLVEVQATYYGMVAKVDDQIGRIMEAVDTFTDPAETIVVLLSDHGDFAGQYGLVEKWDTVFSDCLMRVPFAIRAPGLPAGREYAGLSDHTDLAPTLCELLEMPPLPGMHGSSLAAMVRGEVAREAVFADGGHEDAMLTEFAGATGQRWCEPGDNGRRKAKQETYHQFPDSMMRSRMVRTERYKLVVRLRGDGELYDLAADPWELQNRWHDATLREVRADLMERLLRWNLATDTDRPHQLNFGA
ncbi:MAG: sulfatase-like hydrolase/transferase [Armatimonadaceae bacterium]